MTTPSLTRPVSSPDALHDWIRRHLDLNIPRRAVCPGHCAPFDYLLKAYFEPSADMVVWAPRGGGKTRLAAIATLLDLLHKPKVRVSILGGSLDQSKHVWNHLLDDLVRLGIPAGSLRGRRIRLDELGSVATILAQSQTNVRGQRVQKLRCDEVELFEPDILEAACLTTRTITTDRPRPLADDETDDAGPVPFEPLAVRGAIELISTFHRSSGLMAGVIDRAAANDWPVLSWCLMEVLERCPPERDCESCPLWDDCRGRAKTDCDGYFRIDDAIAMRRRVDLDTWRTEMLCLRPRQRGRVFPMFDRAVHVREDCPAAADPSVPAEISLGIDFGFASPFVCLWVRQVGRCVHVVDEYVQAERMLDEHLDEIERRTQWGRVTRVCCDPAGDGRNEQTARSNIDLLLRRGYTVRRRRSQIVDGLDLIRAALCSAAGEVRLFIHPRCRRLIAAMECYRYPARGGELPLKDGTHDHPIDALRYWFINRPGYGKVEVARY